MKNTIQNRFIMFALFLGVHLGAQVTPANAYEQQPSITNNPPYDDPNDTFYFDLEVSGTIRYKGRTEQYKYFINSRDGSMFFPKNVVLIAQNWGDKERFDGMYLNPNGIVFLYITDLRDNEKTASTVDFFGSSPINENADVFQQFRVNASKSSGPNHSRFGPTTKYRGNINGQQMNMTIANRGVAIALYTDAVGFMAPIFKDHIQKINRVATEVEFGDIKMTIDNILNNGEISYTMSGYKKVGAQIDMQTIRNNPAENYQIVMQNYMAKIMEYSQQLQDIEQRIIDCGTNEACKEQHKRDRDDLNLIIQQEEERLKNTIRDMGILDVYGAED